MIGVILMLLLDGNNTIVSNTFVKFWELSKYIDLLKLLPELKIEIVELYTQFDSIHNVPIDNILKMKKSWEEIPQEIAQTITITQRR